MPISHFNLPPSETHLSILEILTKKNEKVGIAIENCQKSTYFSALKKVAIDIRSASVMFVKGMCISMLWSFQNRCRVTTFMLEATSV